MRSAFLLALLLLAAPALAMIQVGLGNKPVSDHNWPAGALELANLKSRVGWWEGPPFGGGQHQFLYRGGSAEFQAALDHFARIRAPELRLILHEGPHENAFLKQSDNPKSDTRVDWSFTVWDPRSWNHLFNSPTSTVFADAPDDRFRRPVYPPILDVYLAPPAGEGINFEAIKVPSNVKVTDTRATSAGYARNAAPVLRGEVYDMLTSKPVTGGLLIVEKTTDAKSWQRVASAPLDAEGRFELTKAPAGTHRVSVSADGYVTRSLGYLTLGQNELKQFVVHLAPPVEMKGIVLDTDSSPLPGVKVAAREVLASDGRGYPIAQPPHGTTDAQGRFTLAGLPAGHARLSVSAPSYQMLDVLKLHAGPAQDIELRMTATGVVTGKVLNAEDETHVSMEPPGDPIGKWSGSMKINPDGTFRFDGVPPGPYTLSANPHAARAEKDPRAKSIEVKPGQTVEVELTE